MTRACERTRTVDSLCLFLGERIQSIPYFNQLSFLICRAAAISCKLILQNLCFRSRDPEEDGLLLIQQGVPNQIYTVPPAVEGGAAGTSFLGRQVPPSEGRQLVLIGRTYLSANPYSRSLVNNLNSLAGVNGAGMLIADGMIVYHSQAAQMWTPIRVSAAIRPAFFDETASLGTRQLVYYQPVSAIPGQLC
jgi:hypothetical protein